MQKYFFIAVGGALGSMSRVWVDTVVASRMGTKFPYGTFAINITACVMLGFSLVFLSRRAGLNPAWGFLISAGFVGAYSTFSGFEWEAFSHMEGGAFSIALLYLVLSVLLGIIGVWCGATLARSIS